MDDSLAAKKILDEGNICVLCYKGMVFTNNKKGILPLLEFLDSKFDFSMFSSAKKYVDIHEAILYVKLGIKDIYAEKITNEAIEVFTNNDIKYHYSELVDPTIDSYEYQFHEIIKNLCDIDLQIQKLKEKISELKEV